MIKKEYLNVNVRTLRRCPECKSNNYRRTIWHGIVTERKTDQYRSYKVESDSGDTFFCNDCKLMIFQDGSYERSSF